MSAVMEDQVSALLKSMLTENTGRALCDSGGIYGRNWEQNQGKNFDAEPEAELTLIWVEENNAIDVSLDVSIYHLLRQVLELDEFCDEFNERFARMEDWDGDYYGTSAEATQWLQDRDFELIPIGRHDAYNTYNSEEGYIHSQITQGHWFDRDGEPYVLLQIHGGCDARGGYTDAKLFRVEYEEDRYKIMSADCGFGGDNWSVSYHGEWINEDGTSMSDEEWQEIAEELGMKPGDRKTIEGELYVN